MSYHVAHELLLELTVESWDVLIKSLVASSSFDHGLSSLEVTVVSVWTHEVKIVFDMHDRNGDVLVVNANSNALVQVVLSAGSEVDWSFLEKNVDLLLNFPFADLVILHVGTINIVLGRALLILNFLHLLLKDSFLLSRLSVLVNFIS